MYNVHTSMDTKIPIYIIEGQIIVNSVRTLRYVDRQVHNIYTHTYRVLLKKTTKLKVQQVPISYLGIKRKMLEKTFFFFNHNTYVILFHVQSQCRHSSSYSFLPHEVEWTLDIQSTEQKSRPHRDSNPGHAPGVKANIT